MTCTIDVIIEDLRWTDHLDLAAVADTAARATVARLGLAEPSELCLLACSDTRIAGLNRTFRDKAAPTNVLSWPATEIAPAAEGAAPPLPSRDAMDDVVMLGDIALAFETCHREASDAQKPFNDHVMHLIVHGILHLFGYDHETDADARLMESLETAILEEFGIASPYE